MSFNGTQPEATTVRRPSCNLYLRMVRLESTLNTLESASGAAFGVHPGGGNIWDRDAGIRSGGNDRNSEARMISVESLRSRLQSAHRLVASFPSTGIKHVKLP